MNSTKFTPAIPFDESLPPPSRWFEIVSPIPDDFFPQGVQLTIGGFENG